MENNYDDKEPSSPAGGETEQTQPSATQNAAHYAQTRQDDIETEDAELFHQHDTPPPTVIGEGSVTIDIKDDIDEVYTGGGPAKHHRIRPKGTTGGNPHNAVLLECIRLLNGNGETLYVNDAAQDCELVIRLADGSEINVFGGAYYVIQTAGDKRLVKSSGNDKPTGAKRRFRYRHKDTNSKEFSISYVTVRSPTKPFAVDVSRLRARAEFQIMIWPEDVYLP